MFNKIFKFQKFFFLHQDSTIPRQFSRQIDPIPEYETDVVPNTLPIPPQSTANRRSPSPNPVNNLVPPINPNKSSVKRSSNPTTPISTKTDDFVLIPEHITIEKSLPSG
jgi:hypothetical protein